MPFGNTKDMKNVGMAITIVSGLLLLFGSIPILNWSISTSIFAGFTFGTLIGVLNLLVFYYIWKGKI